MKVEEIKKLLPHGAIKIIAEKNNIVEGTVRNILNGKSKTIKSLEVIKTAIELINERKKELEIIEVSIKNL